MMSETPLCKGFRGLLRPRACRSLVFGGGVQDVPPYAGPGNRSASRTGAPETPLWVVEPHLGESAFAGLEFFAVEQDDGGQVFGGSRVEADFCPVLERPGGAF